MHAETRVTVFSIVLNILLCALKFVVGIVGRSQALVADAVHSLSDFLTDAAVLVGLRLAAKPCDEDHAYGHGKYESLSALLIALVLGYVAFRIAENALVALWGVARGVLPARPSVWAVGVAMLSIGLKEFLFQITRRVAVRVGSPALLANAWHHRSDAFSSIATALGVGAAALLGNRWILLDPIAALVVSGLLGWIAWKILRQEIGVLTEQSLPPEKLEKILQMARETPGVGAPHHLRTRRMGRSVVIDLHIRMAADLPLVEAHAIASGLEERLKNVFGADAIIQLHMEPGA